MYICICIHRTSPRPAWTPSGPPWRPTAARRPPGGGGGRGNIIYYDMI